MFKERVPHKLWCTGTSHYWRSPQLALLLFFNYIYIYIYTTGWRDKQILSPALWHTGWRMISTAWWDCSRKAFVFGNYFADGAQSGDLGRLLVYTSTAVHGVLVGIWWNITDSATYLDSCIFMTIQKTLTRHHSYDQPWKLRTILH